MLKSLFNVVLLWLLCLPVLAQDIAVSGRVTSSDDGSALPGVSVQVKGTTRGTTTDASGNYRLNAPANAQLVFSFIGYKTQEVAVGNRTTVNLSLASDASVLNEVVVVGYGTQSKKTITGAIATVDGKSISDKPVQSFDQALQGRAAGVSITTPNGVLNNAPVIRVRGVSSISGSSSPLIVVDGLPINSGNVSQGGFTVNNPLGDINPNDIESLDILKDASATAIYGSRAAAGVILITTKKGKEGRAQVSYDSWLGATQPFRLFNMLNAQQFMDYKNLAARNAGLPDQFFPTTNPDGSIADTDWYDLIYRTGYGQNHNLNVNGGNKDTRYAFSVGYTKQQGMIQKNDFSRFTGRMNISHQLNKAVRVGANISLANSFNQSPNTGTTGAFSTGGLGRLPLVLAPNVAPRNPDGSYNINRAANNLGLGKNLIGPGGYYNPLPDLELSKFTSENNHLIGNVFADVFLLPGLVFRTSYGLDQTTVEDIDFRNSVHGEAGTVGGQATNIYSNIKQWNWQNYLTYDFNFGKNNFQTIVGTESQKQMFNIWGGTRQGLSDPFFTSYQGNFTTNNPPPGLQTENALLSYYGRLNYDFDKRYLFSFTLRRDGFSAYSVDNKWGNFPGASAGWRISEEDFWKNSALGRVVNEFKLRASWGRVGNTGIGNFASLSLFNSGLYGTVPTFAFAQAGNPALRWEISTNTDFGVAFGLFNDRITGELTYFNKQLDDLVLNEPQAPSRGIPGNSIATNVGSMVNRGLELTLTANTYTRGKFNWTTSFNLTTLNNEVLALANNNADIFGSTGGLESSNIIRVGQSAGSIFAIRTNGVNPANGRRIFINAAGREVQYDHAAAPAQRWTYVSDGAVAPAIQGTDRVVIGNALPKYYGGFDNTFKYGNLDLSIFLQYSGGNYIYNGTKAGLRDQRPWNNHTDVLNHWKQPGDITNIPRPVLNDNISNGSANPISENVEKGDFIRGRNILLAYTFRNNLLRKANINSLRLYGQVQNAFVITKYSGADPEISTNRDTNVAPGVDRNSTPQARTYTLGLGLTF
ncbi:SusC/RagA family TonB-linked outer membrane protein [Rudanella paleaurantiibacter]|uniref:SusC/RagA family TonB-linked outer membrane protein n=1 Tax=Rudanella paleaurantiibacter TaxID=2614655 RepID=A0A7J5U0Q9_9BACT|nr:TonB-dependent receptor [Rudanella paleaurantiibacter]KAB7731269.1 SusC/RagA family TonB-linked outer membrane protein [Rudanella paleaurantiibacter]